MYAGRIRMREREVQQFKDQKEMLEGRKARLEKARTQLSSSEGTLDGHAPLIKDPAINSAQWKGRKADKHEEYRESMKEGQSKGRQRIADLRELIQDAIANADSGIRYCSAQAGWRERELKTLNRQQRRFEAAKASESS
ncbi:DUF5082 family protein [Bacillus sp. FSL W7-1360]